MPPQGYLVSLGAPPRQVPWVNLDQFSVHFNSDPKVNPDDLRVFGVNVREYPVTSVRFDYDPAGYQGTATWTFARPLVNDRVLFVLSERVVFDGDGDGQPGGDFRQRLNVLPGDGDRDGIVGASDFLAVRREMGTNSVDPGSGPHSYVAFDDLNGDGRINAIDFAGVKARLGTRLPVREPSPPGAAAALISVGSAGPTADLFGSRPILPA